MAPRHALRFLLPLILVGALTATTFADAEAGQRRKVVQPETTITSGPEGTIATSSATFTFTSSIAGSFDCRLDGTGWSGCASPKAYTGLAEGQHLFEVRATSRQGRRRSSGPGRRARRSRRVADATPASRSFTVDLPDSGGPATPADTTAPDTTITAGPGGTVDSGAASFAFTSTEPGSTYTCRLDAGSWSSCSSPKSYAGLSDGSHAFEVRATDAAGNTDATPARRSFTVATAPPTDPPSCGFGTFSATNTPGACWRPYAETAPWNRGIPASPRLRPDSSAIVSRLLGFGGPDNISVGGTYDWKHPLYFSQPSDPVFTVHCAKPWGTCEVEGAQIRIPDAARPASGGDGHMAVIDQASGWEYDFWQVQSKPAGGGTLTISWGGKTRIGTPESDGLESNATAAWFGLAAGVIRPAELEAGQINHALFMTVKCTNGTSVWPAGSGAGTSCSSKGLSNSGAPAMGQHFMLDMTEAEIDALSVPTWKKTILKAMARYGMFVGDTGGTGWGVQFESSASYTSFGLKDPWVRLGDLWGVPKYPDPSVGPERVFKLSGAADWSRLRAVDPCVSRGMC